MKKLDDMVYVVRGDSSERMSAWKLRLPTSPSSQYGTSSWSRHATKHSARKSGMSPG